MPNFYTSILFTSPPYSLVTDEIARLLSKIKWIRFIRFACDTTSAVEPLLKTLEKLNKYGVKNYRIFVYVPIKDVEDANNRCKILKRLGVNPQKRQPSRCAVTLQSPLADMEHKTYILIVEQFFAVNGRRFFFPVWLIQTVFLFFLPRIH